VCRIHFDCTPAGGAASIFRTRTRNINNVAQADQASRQQQRGAPKLGVAVLSALASVIGLRFPGVYRSTDWNGMSVGNDLVTLILAVPVLVLAIIHSARGSVRARLVWLGALYYMFYNYAFYVFGPSVTKLICRSSPLSRSPGLR
jgi:hypothetical protein